MSAVAPSSEILLLCYHGISQRWPDATSVTPDHLRAHLEVLARRGFRGMTLTDALTAPKGRRVLVVTFDDAMRSVFELARPILDRLGFPGTVFVPTDFPDSGRLMGWDGFDCWLGTEHEPELQCMDWEELRILSRSGWEVASHTCSHPRLTQVDDAALAHELTRSREICEKEIGVPCAAIAYPYSDEDDRVVEATRQAGYAIGVTVALRHVDPMPLRWPRVGINHGDSARRLNARLMRRRHPLLDGATGRALRLARLGAAGLRR